MRYHFLSAKMFRSVLVFIFAVATTSYGLPEGRIVGGKITTIEEHPYQVSLRYGNTHNCGGSLIRRDVVLTAAHCINNWPIFYSVRAGSNYTQIGGQVAQVTSICRHPKFREGLLDYDVALLKLNIPLNLNSAVQLINLQNFGEEVPANTMATVTGWGFMELDGGLLSENLKKVEVPKVDQKICQEAYELQLQTSITDRMTCYGYIEGGRDSCQGDSGGPLVANGKQVGIVSGGNGCGYPYSPGVYTRLENEEIYYHINNCLANFDYL